jgi:hypothetical protein
MFTKTKGRAGGNRTPRFANPGASVLTNIAKGLVLKQRMHSLQRSARPFILVNEKKYNALFPA